VSVCARIRYNNVCALVVVGRCARARVCVLRSAGRRRESGAFVSFLLFVAGRGTEYYLCAARRRGKKYNNNNNNNVRRILYIVEKKIIIIIFRSPRASWILRASTPDETGQWRRRADRHI